MAEYIERGFALDVVKRTSGDYAAAFAEIAHAPAADVVEVRHGRWENGGNGLYDTCTACGKEIYLAIPMNYCPECGALMDGKEDEHD